MLADFRAFTRNEEDRLVKFTHELLYPEEPQTTIADVLSEQLAKTAP